MDNPVSIETKGNIAVLTIDNPPVNALGANVRQGLIDALDQLKSSQEIGAVVLTGSGRFFSAGADIREFGKPRVLPSLPDVIAMLEKYHLPIMAAINGRALGGGLELALGCRYRACSPQAKLGLPEVNLGLIPGAGGTQRLPRLVGTKNAAQMICYGKPIGPKDASNIGLVDTVFADNLLENAVKHARSIVQCVEDGTVTIKPSLAEAPYKDEIDLDYWLPQFQQELVKKSKGQLSPLKALEAVATANYESLDEGLAKERALFEDCMQSEQRAGLIHAFFSERQVTKIPKYDKYDPLPIQKVGVLGAGTMGVGISIAFASKGYQVFLYDINEDVLSAAQNRIEETLAVNVKKGRMSSEAHDATIAHLSYHSELKAMKETDLVIEAVVERMDVKKSVFKELDGLLKPHAILTSNTSYLDINEIGSVTSREDKVIGMHFFSPANIMKLLEIIKTDKASGETIATVLAVAKKIGKTPVIAGMCDGFIGNRIFKTYRKQAEFLVEDGALPQDVDRILKDFGFAMGPFAVSDLAGLDIGWHTRRREDATRPKTERYTDLPDRLYELGRLGQKTGAGWYKYEEGNRTPMVDEEVEALILKACEENNIKRRKISDDEIRDRIFFAMINEGANILYENVAERALDIDVVYLHGYGFPRYRGGPMFYADQVGPQKILESINKYAAHDPDSWKASPLLEILSKKGTGFHDIDAKSS